MKFCNGNVMVYVAVGSKARGLPPPSAGTRHTNITRDAADRNADSQLDMRVVRFPIQK